MAISGRHEESRKPGARRARSTSVVLPMVASLCLPPAAFLAFGNGWGPPAVYRGVGPAPMGQQPICGPVAVVNLCALHGISTDLVSATRLTGLTPDGVRLEDCEDALRKLGLPCRRKVVAALGDLPEAFPCLGVFRAAHSFHGVVVCRDGERITIIDGAAVFAAPASDLNRSFTGVALVPE